MSVTNGSGKDALFDKQAAALGAAGEPGSSSLESGTREQALLESGTREQALLESGSIESSASERSSSSPPPATVANIAEGYLAVPGGIRLYHCEFVPERRSKQQGGAVVAIMHGYGEHCRRYDELASYLVHKGHAVCLLDARGHGRSQGQRGYVRHFDEYVEDFLVFLERVRAQHRGRPLYVLGHSNGALVALRAILRGLEGVHGLVLTGPLLGLQARRKAVPDPLARLLSRLLPWLPLPNGIRAEDLTHDPALLAARGQDRWVHAFATPRWYWAMTLAAREVLAAAPRLALPMLIVQGELDTFVDPALVADFYARVGSADKQLVVRPGERHEVLNETGRAELFRRIAAWLKRSRSA
jgi:alpha-beta hydrolase superfamily lysophospholipase